MTGKRRDNLKRRLAFQQGGGWIVWDEYKVLAAPCAYCGFRTAAMKMTLDHIVPLRWHGSSAFENLALACAQCNNRKDSKHPSDIKWTWEQLDRLQRKPWKRGMRPLSMVSDD